MDTLTSLDGHVVLIAGGTGSWGVELLRHILQRYAPAEVRVVSRGEIRQVEMGYQFPDPRVNFMIGDVRDSVRMEQVTRGADVVFHLAALKHVPICERQPQEAVATNVYGAQVMLHACVRNGVRHFVYVSTDKAVEPINVYGSSKACAEKLVVSAGGADLRIACIRAGNVMGSNGSVIPLFLKQLADDREIRVTHPDMTRFVMPLPRAIELLMQTTFRAHGREIFVTRMPSVRIMDLAEVMAEHHGVEKTRIRVTGIRPGEKIDELLVSRLEVPRTRLLDEYIVLLPHDPTDVLHETYANLPRLEMEEYSSAALPPLSRDEIKLLLDSQGMLSAPEGESITLRTQGHWSSN